MMQPTLLQADDMHSPCTSETRDDADMGTVMRSKRFTSMMEADKNMELNLDAMFFKTSKYNTTTGRSK